MREVINVHIGQGGIQTAHAMWELFCAEHGINHRGHLKDEKLDDEDFTFESFFELTPKRQYVPRALLVDLEPSVIDEIRIGMYRGLFHPDRMITSNEDAANNYARGRHTIGRLKIEEAFDQLRKVAEGCDHIQGFIMTNSIGGGTGSGYGSMFMEKLTDEFGKRPKIQPNIFPSSRLATAMVEPYNSVLSMHSTMDYTDLSLVYDNEALFKIIKNNIGILSPSFHHINRLTALALSSLTLSLRFEGVLSSDINQILTNLVPYPRIHFPTLSYGPVLSQDRAERTNLNESTITKMVFHEDHQMMSACDPKLGRYMACALNFRGQAVFSQINKTIKNIKKNMDIQWVDWCPTGFKFGFNHAKPITVDGSEIACANLSVTMLSNNTCIAQPFRILSNKFYLLFNKRAFVHHYVGEGMEEGELAEAIDNMKSLITDYEEATMETGEGDESKHMTASNSSMQDPSNREAISPMTDEYNYQEPEVGGGSPVMDAYNDYEHTSPVPDSSNVDANVASEDEPIDVDNANIDV